MAIGGRQIITPTPGTTVTLTIQTDVPAITARWTIAQATTVVISGAPQDGTELNVIVTNDGVSARVLTFGTGFRAGGTATGVVNRRSTISFIADGGIFLEKCRTVGSLLL